MLSPVVSQLLERARTRFGLEVEILDSGLQSMYPESATELTRIIHDSPAVRQTLLDVMVAGRPQQVESGIGQYRVYPLRPSTKRRQPSGLLAVRVDPHVAAVSGGEPWSELARAVVEADLTSVEGLTQEQQRSRRYVGVLAFLDYLVGTAEKRAVTEALVQAAAIWYDAEARVYRRSGAGHFVLHTWLPGAAPDDSFRTLSPAFVGTGFELRRTSLPAGSSSATALQEALLVPMKGVRGVDWVLVLIGAVPQEAEPVLSVVAQVAATQLGVLNAYSLDHVRARFEALASRAAAAPELVAMRVVQELVQLTGAAGAALTLVRNDDARCIAALGPTSSDIRPVPPDHDVRDADRLVLLLPLGDRTRGVLEVQASANGELADAAVDVAEVCGGVLRVWLGGTLASLENAGMFLDRGVATGDFGRRVHEELERAKRFDLSLALIVVEVPSTWGAVAEVKEALRRELRGSDVLGAMGSYQVGALLTHTDDSALDKVVQRLRRRLADAAAQLNVAEVRLGRAALSPNCGTAEALLTAAILTAEPVIVH